MSEFANEDGVARDEEVGTPVGSEQGMADPVPAGAADDDDWDD
jgi:hypothetical protein